MNIHQLRCFMTVARVGHFGRAAEQLHLTTSPVSRAVKELERQLGGDLFVRRYHQIELTAKGRHFLSRVEPIVAELDQLRAEVRELVLAAPPLRLGGATLAPTAVLDWVVDVASKVDPSRALEVTLASSAELSLSVASGEIDLAVVHLPVDAPNVRAFPIVTYTMTAVLRSDDPLACRDALRTADLADHTYVMMGDRDQPASAQHLCAGVAAHGVNQVETVPVGDVILYAAKVWQRGMFGLLPREMDMDRMFDEPRFARVPVVDAPSLVVGVAWRAADGPVDGRVESILSLLRGGFLSPCRPTR